MKTNSENLFQVKKNNKIYRTVVIDDSREITGFQHKWTYYAIGL